MFVVVYQTGPLGYLITTRKALGVLLGNKIRDSRLQLFLLKWTLTLLVLLGAGIGGFNLLPTLLALGVFSQIICLCTVLLWIGSGDIFLKFALEDEGFYNLATQGHALSVFEDTDSSLPQPTN